MQYLLTGPTVGAIYALVALGFSIIFDAGHVINFAQGEFVMIGGMAAVSLTAALVVADRVYVLETGRVVLTGGGAELFDDEKVKEVYLGL